MKKVAIYTRVSTYDQKTLLTQLNACSEYSKAREWVISHKIQEIASGAKKRPEREKLLKLCRQRQIDIVVVWKLDRWGRSTADIVTTLQELQELNIQFVSITEALDFTTAIGRAMSGLLAVFAEFEREMIRERVKTGLEQAKRKGITLGRPAKIRSQKEEILKLWEKHKNKSVIAKELGISRRSVSRYLESHINNSTNS